MCILFKLCKRTLLLEKTRGGSGKGGGVFNFPPCLIRGTEQAGALCMQEFISPHLSLHCPSLCYFSYVNCSAGFVLLHLFLGRLGDDHVCHGHCSLQEQFHGGGDF